MKRVALAVLWILGFLWSLPFLLLRLLMDGTQWLVGKISWTLVQPGLWAMSFANECAERDEQ